jgi:hypothetical protein
VSLQAYFDAQPIMDLTVRRGPAPGASTFSGVPRKHPYDESKFVLFCDPLTSSPRLIEFKFTDIVGAEDLPSPVSESGESLPMVKIWVRKGSFAIQYEPLEVDDPPRSMKESATLRESVMKGMFGRKP